MNFIEIMSKWDGTYSYKEASNVEMCIVGTFFTDDVGCSGRLTFRNWAAAGIDGSGAAGNITFLERDGDDILLEDQCSVEPVPTIVRMTAKQFIDLFDEWQEKVARTRPKRVVIKHDKGFYWMETFDE